MQIKVRYTDSNLPRIEKIAFGDWIDLRAAQTISMKEGEVARISLGVAMQLPEGYEAHVVPRSSTPKKFGITLTNSIGIIDNSYCGNDDIWMFEAKALRDTVINYGDRICQFRIVKKMPEISIVEVERLDNENRGGFGSTGTN